MPVILSYAGKHEQENGGPSSPGYKLRISKK
jgi:hypothetical protein